MPYIEKNKRPELNDIIYLMHEKNVSANGDLNYILYKYCKNYVKPSYNEYKNFIGELRQCVVEIERRILAPYEDEKIKSNGDVD